MSLTVLGWLLIVSSIALSALCIFQLRSADWRWEHFSLELGSPPEDIGSRFKFGKANVGTAGPLIMVAAVLLLVPIIGAATSHLGDHRREETGSEDTDEGMLARLEDYTRSIEAEKPARKATAGDLLPDVNTMIERLAARLRSAPDDVQGWRTLGWSYFNTGLYGEAASAYARAVELDPNSAEIKASYEEAKAKASEGSDPAIGSPIQPEAVGEVGDVGQTVKSAAKAEASPPHESDVSIRSMVDGLANRLESSPRDVEGWTRLMRSRVVLGEREIAETAFRKALEVFKDDSAASANITAAAIELGLKVE
ncbi:tetratricopeptide repeat protein [Hyphomicrobium sp.]|uniref:tetratricopeptide repeat protein n=1 Tax=Hyphomicrobium sp. TaxID=82 RepID=UPI002E36399B|nr:tetratricopeptide repeat protein [Hyphomicrobium sp.]HEX2841692.1 tetratricopeptide repeat protein [Hyphomicrobium sp.]